MKQKVVRKNNENIYYMGNAQGGGFRYDVLKVKKKRTLKSKERASISRRGKKRRSVGKNKSMRKHRRGRKRRKTMKQ